MIKPINLFPGLSPKRHDTKSATGWNIHVTPPAAVGGPTVIVALTDEQYARYVLWRDSGLLIQTALPDLSDSEREMLMTGLTDEAFAAAAREEDES